MIILDTNVVSALMQDPSDSSVVDWLDRQPQSSIWTTSITVFEIGLGLQLLPPGKRREALARVFNTMLERIEQRVAPFDEDAARLAADLSALRRRKGRVGEFRDTMIAGIVMARHAVLATRNIAHFADLSSVIINPWTA
jgi:hypothetical protein